LKRPAHGFRNGLRRVAETVLKIGRCWQIGRLDHRTRMRQGFFAGNLTILSSKRRCETAARGCDGLKSKAGDDSCRTGVEYVSDNEDAGTGMQRIERFGFLS